MNENQKSPVIANTSKEEETRLSATANVWLALSSSSVINKEISEEEKMHLPLKIFDGKKASISDLTQASSSYLWLRRIKEIFLVFGTNNENDPLIIHDMNYARQEMMETTEIFLENAKPKQQTHDQVISQEDQNKWEAEKSAVHNFQKKFYRRNKNMNTMAEPTIVIDSETNKAMHYSNSIWWYSWNEAFIYRQINNTLRMENFELLMAYRYFISDLCCMIKEYYDKQSEQRPSMVFRAEWIDKSQLETLKKASSEKGHLLSMNGFISTTTDRKISTEYANKSCTRPNVVSVVYEITIDPSRSYTEFACIKNISYHPEEEEVLFSIGAVFSIDSVCDPVAPNHFYTIQAVACEYNESIIDDMKLKLRKYTQPELYILLTKYLIELEQYRTVRKSLINLLNNSHVIINDDSSLASAYNCMGQIYSRQELFGDAIIYYKQALKYQVRFDSSNNNALAECYNNIGSVLLEQKYFNEALGHLQEAYRIQNLQTIDKKHLITIYTNLGRVYASINNFLEAEKYFSSAEQLIKQDKQVIAYDALEKSLIEADTTFYTILFKEQRDKILNPSLYSRQHHVYALGYDDATKIYEKILPLTHSKLIRTMKYRILALYIANMSYDTIHFKSLPTLINLQPTASHTNELEILNLLGSFFVNKTLKGDLSQYRRYDLAMEYWKKIVRPTIYLNNNYNNDDAVNEFIYSSYNIAIEYFKEQEQISKNILSLGILFALKGDIDNAILYLSKVNLNDKNDLLICSILLGNLYNLEKNFSIAIQHYSQALKFVDDNNQSMKIELYLALANSDKDNTLQILQQLEKDMKKYGNDLDDDIIKIRSIIYENIAYELIKNKQHNKAFNYADKAKDLKLKYLSNNHPDLAKTYILIGQIFENTQQYRQALEQYEKANEIQHVNLSNDHIDIMKLKLQIGYIHCQMRKLDKLPQDFKGKIELYSTIECFASSIKLFHAASELSEKEHKYNDAYQYELNSILVQQYQWPETFFFEIIHENNEDLHVLDDLKQLLPTSRIQLKTILQNFYHIFTQCDIIQQRKQLDNNSLVDSMKNSKEKIRNLKALLLSLWSNEEEEQNNINDTGKDANELIRWELAFEIGTFTWNMEYKFKSLPNFKASISIEILEKDKEVTQYLCLFIYDLLNYYNFKNDDKSINDDGNYAQVDDTADRNDEDPLKVVKSLAIDYINYGKEFIRLHDLTGAAKKLIPALELCTHYFKLKNDSDNNNDNDQNNNTIITSFIDDLQKFVSNDFSPIINMLKTNLCYCLPVEIKIKQDFQVWLLLKRAILNKKYGLQSTAVECYNDCIELIKQSNAPSSSVQIATIQYSLYSLGISEIKIPDDISLLDSFLLETKTYNLCNLNKTILVLNHSFQFDKELPKYIGQYLFDIGDYNEALTYWNSILEQQNKFISKIVGNMILSSTKSLQQIHDEMKRVYNDCIQQLNLILSAYMRCTLLLIKHIDILLSMEYLIIKDLHKYNSQFKSCIDRAKAISIYINGNNNEISNQCQVLIIETQTKVGKATTAYYRNNPNRHMAC